MSKYSRQPSWKLGLPAGLLVLVYAASARSFVLDGSKWSSNPTMSVNLSSFWNPESEAALGRWNLVPGHTLIFLIDNDNHDHCDFGTLCLGTDGNAVEWDDFSNGVCDDPADTSLALTRTASFAGSFCNADVLFNTSVPWTKLPRECTTTPEYNLNSVALHEFGHALGLDHEDDELATMNSKYHASDRRIHGDDQAGIRAVYPSGPTVNLMASHWEKSMPGAVSADLVEPPDSPVFRGNSINFEYTIENAGTATVTFDVGFYLSTDSTISITDTLIGVSTGGVISAGNSGQDSRSLTIPPGTPPGIYWIGAVIDYNDSLAESNEVDNAFEPCVSTTVTQRYYETPALGPLGVGALLLALLLLGHHLLRVKRTPSLRR